MVWFISVSENSEGPYSTEEVKGFIDTGYISPENLIWGRGMKEWVSVTEWVNGNYAEKIAKRTTKESLWHYAQDGVSKGPMTRSALILELSNISNKSLTLVWTKGMKTWTKLFELPDFIEELGLSRRQHPRAPIQGHVIIPTKKGAVFCKLQTISTGGLGINDTSKQLKTGDLIYLNINAKKLGDMISTKAKVQYTTELGNAGIQFKSISQEAKSKIIEYINTYQKVDSPQKVA